MIVLNVFLLAVQADFPNPPKLFGKIDPWVAVNIGFLSFFSMELGFRFITFGCKSFWCDDDPAARLKLQRQVEGERQTAAEQAAINEGAWLWNYFDFFIVGIGWIDLVMTVCTEGGNEGTKYLQILRVIRILRILRVLRIFRALNKLQWLVQGLIESLGIVAWIVLMMWVIMLMISIFLTTLVGQNPDLWDKGDQKAILLYFGTVPKSMQTLFQYLTLDDWAMISRLVAKKMPWMMVVFLGYVVFAAFVILSLLTGVMAEHMTNLREMQEEDEKAEQRLKQQEAERTFFEAFKKLDTSMTRKISRAEFVEMMKDEELLTKLDDICVNLRDSFP